MLLLNTFKKDLFYEVNGKSYELTNTNTCILLKNNLDFVS